MYFVRCVRVGFLSIVVVAFLTQAPKHKGLTPGSSWTLDNNDDPCDDNYPRHHTFTRNLYYVLLFL